MSEFRDALGNIVQINENLGRIVSLSPSVTEILFEIGIGSNLVGVSAFCKRPAETDQIRKVGSYGTARRNKENSAKMVWRFWCKIS